MTNYMCKHVLFLEIVPFDAKKYFFSHCSVPLGAMLHLREEGRERLSKREKRKEGKSVKASKVVRNLILQMISSANINISIVQH